MIIIKPIKTDSVYMYEIGLLSQLAYELNYHFKSARNI